MFFFLELQTLLEVIENLCAISLLELYEGRSSQLYTQLLQLRKESLKKVQAFTGFEPLTHCLSLYRNDRFPEKQVCLTNNI